MELRYRMQSVRTGWGMESPATKDGKKQLLAARRADPEKFKWCRVYLVQQTHPTTVPLGRPFELTHRKYT